MANLQSLTLGSSGYLKLPSGTSQERPGDVITYFTEVGTTNWSVPTGVSSVSVLVIGAGGGGGQSHIGGGGGGTYAHLF